MYRCRNTKEYLRTEQNDPPAQEECLGVVVSVGGCDCDSSRGFPEIRSCTGVCLYVSLIVISRSRMDQSHGCIPAIPNPPARRSMVLGLIRTPLVDLYCGWCYCLLSEGC
eukprot:scaffold14401_cov58-Cyclotella_meneghiniana.AAC.9